MIVSASGYYPVENPNGIDERVLILEDKSHFTNRDKPHITDNSEISRIIEQADEVYTNGRGLYIFVIYENGVAKIVHAYDQSLVSEAPKDEIVVSTAYSVKEDPIQFIENIIQSKLLDKIYPTDD